MPLRGFHTDDSPEGAAVDSPGQRPGRATNALGEGGRLHHGKIGGSLMSLTDLQRRCLDEQGFLVLADFIPGELLARLRRRIDQLFAAEGEEAGSEFKKERGCLRLANLVDKDEVFREVIALPQLLPYVRH